jgi:cAMP-dependent protein kinase regulator
MFGDTAIIYNCPRTATIIANNNECTAFSLDRQTYYYIVRDSTLQRRERLMKMLADVPILQPLDIYERSKILDACRHTEYDVGECVISEGDHGEEFFILLEGEACATKLFDVNKESTVVKEYSAGDYFGERALLKNTTRAASIIAKTDIKCLVLDRDRFKKLLGSVEHILKRNMKIYINYIEK